LVPIDFSYVTSYRL